MTRFVLVRLTPLLLCTLSACTASHEPSVDKNTNWLNPCERDADCEDTDCVCGICTLRCETDAFCENTPSASVCFDRSTTVYEALCGDCDAEETAGLCLPACGPDESCDADMTCYAGACLPEAPDDVQLSEAAPDFSQPISLPEPETVITGDFDKSALIGTWGGQATGHIPPFVRGPMQLVIEEAANGQGLEGTLSFLCGGDDCAPMGPPRDVIDPDIGYPPGLDEVDQALLLLSFLPRFGYRILDGRVDEERLSFWFSAADLWREWCELQTPYRFDAGDREEYSCEPDPEPSFPRDFSIENSNSKVLLCSADASVCSCSEDGCTVQHRGFGSTLDLLMDGDIMRGGFMNFSGFFPVAFVKEGGSIREEDIEDIEDFSTVSEWRAHTPRRSIEAPPSAQIPTGVWIGESKDNPHSLESKCITLTIEPGTTSTLASGFVVFGESEPPPPATDPDRGYPPGDSEDDLERTVQSPTEGFAYSILDGHATQDGRLRFRIAILELYKEWCAFQTSYFGTGSGYFGYSCRPYSAYTGISGPICRVPTVSENGVVFYETVPCDLDPSKYWLCGGEDGPCICFDDGCAAFMNSTIGFDLRVNTTSMEGLITYSTGSVPTEVRLNKLR